MYFRYDIFLVEDDTIEILYQESQLYNINDSQCTAMPSIILKMICFSSSEIQNMKSKYFQWYLFILLDNDMA